MTLELAEQPWLERMVRRGALIVCNHSGGKDSQAMLVELAKVVPREQLLVAHAHLSDELVPYGVVWPGTQDHALSHAQALELPMVVSEGRWGAQTLHEAGVVDPKTWMAYAERRARVTEGRGSSPFPGPREDMRWCTADLKTGPLNSDCLQYAKSNGFRIIVHALGLRAGESDNRAKKPAVRPQRRRLNAAGLASVTDEAREVPSKYWAAGIEGWDYLPIKEMTRPEVFATIYGAGQRPHWAYEAGNARLSCAFCIYSTSRDCRRAAVYLPELFQRLVELEARVGFSLKAHKIRGVASTQPWPMEQFARISVEQAFRQRATAPGAYPPAGVFRTDRPVGEVNRVLEDHEAEPPCDAGMVGEGSGVEFDKKGTCTSRGSKRTAKGEQLPMFPDEPRKVWRMV